MWIKGPLPIDTHGRGLVLPTQAALSVHAIYGGADYFAEFHGGHAVLVGLADQRTIVLQPDQVAEYYVVGPSSLKQDY